jgi:hypothetical protein
VATQLYAKKWLIHASYTPQPKEIRANCGLAVNPCVGFINKLRKGNTAKVPRKPVIFKIQTNNHFTKIAQAHGFVRVSCKKVSVSNTSTTFHVHGGF